MPLCCGKLSGELFSLVFIWIASHSHSKLCLSINLSRKSLSSRSQNPELDSLNSWPSSNLAYIYPITYLWTVMIYLIDFSVSVLLEEGILYYTTDPNKYFLNNWMKIYEYLDLSFGSFARDKEAWDTLDFQTRLFYLHFWKIFPMKKCNWRMLERSQRNME